jgi:subtilisin family serine protease
VHLTRALASLAGLALAGAALTPAASADEADVTHLLLGNGGALPAGLEAKVTAAGGQLQAAYPFGVATVSAPASFTGVKGTTSIVDPGFTTSYGPRVEADADALPPGSGNDDGFFDLQWGHVPVRAVQAWEAGVTGEGVRVAVLDGGFDTDHPDLAPNVNLALSEDFTGEGLEYALADPFSHGTHVAGTIAAADNGLGTIGVAPDAELVLVKVLGDAGTGDFADVFEGIYHAADVDADVINMSLGAIIPRSEAGTTQLAVAMNRAVTYAHQQGSTVIVSAGNAAQDLDGDGNLVRFLTSASHAIGISATAPTGWALDPTGVDFATPASYTNYGTSMVDFSAPGGDTAYPGNESCTVAGLVRPCFVFDLVFSTGSQGSYYWSGGTSMAAPHAAGVAALIISEHGGELAPSHVQREMRARAVDEGKPGTDDFHGRGAVTSGY